MGLRDQWVYLDHVRPYVAAWTQKINSEIKWGPNVILPSLFFLSTPLSISPPCFLGANRGWQLGRFKVEKCTATNSSRWWPWWQPDVVAGGRARSGNQERWHGAVTRGGHKFPENQLPNRTEPKWRFFWMFGLWRGFDFDLDWWSVYSSVSTCSEPISPNKP